MKNFFKGKVATAIVLLSTFVLAGVAIFTAIRLYQLRQTSVAPNVPSSIPKAAGGLEAPCGFDERTGETIECAPGLTCVQPEVGIGLGVCRGDLGASNCELSFTLTTPTGSPTPMQVSCNQSCNTTVNPPISCQQNLICYTSGSSDGASGLCRNLNCTSKTDCLCETTTPTPTPTATATANATATSTPTSTPTATATATSVPNTTATATATSTAKAATSTNTPTPTQPTLPQSGTDWPTVLGIGIGILTIVGSLLLAI